MIDFRVDEAVRSSLLIIVQHIFQINHSFENQHNFTFSIILMLMKNIAKAMRDTLVSVKNIKKLQIVFSSKILS